MKRPAEFLSELHLEDISEGRETRAFRLLAPFQVYSAVLEAEIVVPEGFVSDGESVPTWLQGIAPPFGMSKRAAIAHDWLYAKRGFQGTDGLWRSVTRKEADAVYFELVELKGLPAWRSNLRWAVLRCVGWIAWHNDAKKV